MCFRTSPVNVFVSLICKRNARNNFIFHVFSVCVIKWLDYDNAGDNLISDPINVTVFRKDEVFLLFTKYDPTTLFDNCLLSVCN